MYANMQNKDVMSSLTGTDSEAFPSELSFLPDVMAGDTVFSWAARYHRLSGHASPSLTNCILFGRREGRLRHDFPTNLAWFCEQTGNLMGGAEQVARERTTLGFFLPFLTEAQACEAIACLSNGPIARINYLLGHANTGLGNHYPLKACRACNEQDLATRHSPRWRADHQWPSVWVCLEHGQILQMVAPPVGKRLYKDWLLPDDIEQSNWWSPTIVQAEGEEVLLRLAWMNMGVLNKPSLRFDPEILRLTYLEGAAQRNWLDPGGALRLDQLRTTFKAEHDVLACLPGWGFLNGVSQANGGILGMLMHHYPGRRHPVVHLILMSFLFESAERFLQEYAAVEARTLSATSEEMAGEWRDPRRERLAHMVRVRGYSLNRAAQELGINVGQAVSWAKKDGLPYVPRPRVLTAEKERNLQAKLKAGASRDAIVESLGVRRSFLKVYLAAHPDLKEEWKTLEQANSLERYRQHFLDLLESHPGMPSKLLRQIPGNGYSWLVRHDIEWLRSKLPVLG